MLCSHLLCEVDSFDPKMNMENLTKCLQSLKEFYRDLRLDKVRITSTTIQSKQTVVYGNDGM